MKGMSVGTSATKPLVSAASTSRAPRSRRRFREDATEAALVAMLQALDNKPSMSRSGSEDPSLGSQPTWHSSDVEGAVLSRGRRSSDPPK